MEYYFRQNKGNGIGNFISVTPAIKLYNRVFDRRLNVFFETEHVKDMFVKCPFINIINDKQGMEEFGNNVINFGLDYFKTKSEYRYFLDKFTNFFSINIEEKTKNKLEFDSYVDIYGENQSKDHVVIVNGCLKNSIWERKKDPGIEIYDYIINKISIDKEIIIVGNTNDFLKMENFRKYKNVRFNLNNIKLALKDINESQYVIANDTGLYHVTSALKIPQFVLWKDTPRVKNQVKITTNTFSYEKNWKSDFDKWINNH